MEFIKGWSIHIAAIASAITLITISITLLILLVHITESISELRVNIANMESKLNILMPDDDPLKYLRTLIQ